MALSAAFVDNHISTWQTNLTTGFYAHRKHWPAHLFHHAPIENAIGILRDGCIRSRNDDQNQRERDVAAPGVIDARDYAHNSARLYFRPKTPTQWHIEGIRKIGECNYGEAAHAPIFVMFLLDAKAILTSEMYSSLTKTCKLGILFQEAPSIISRKFPFRKFSPKDLPGVIDPIQMRAALKFYATPRLICATA